MFTSVSQLTHCSNWLTPRLPAISHQPLTILTAVLRPAPNRSCSLLYSLNTGLAENTFSNSSSIVAARSYRTDRVETTASHLLHCCVLRICCLAMGVFAEPFPSNDYLCWLHSFYLEQICRNTFLRRWIYFDEVWHDVKGLVWEGFSCAGIRDPDTKCHFPRNTLCRSHSVCCTSVFMSNNSLPSR
jgi:hypothetical protein